MKGVLWVCSVKKWVGFFYDIAALNVLDHANTLSTSLLHLICFDPKHIKCSKDADNVFAWSHLPTRAHPRCTRATHGPQPAKMARCNHRSGHHSSTALTSYYMYAAVHTRRRTMGFDRMLLTNEYRRIRKQVCIWMFYSKFKFSNFV